MNLTAFMRCPTVCKGDHTLASVEVLHAAGAVEGHLCRAPQTRRRGRATLHALEQVGEGAARQELRDHHVGLAVGDCAQELHRVRVVHLLQCVQLRPEATQYHVSEQDTFASQILARTLRFLILHKFCMQRKVSKISQIRLIAYAT